MLMVGALVLDNAGTAHSRGEALLSGTALFTAGGIALAKQLSKTMTNPAKVVRVRILGGISLSYRYYFAHRTSWDAQHDWNALLQCCWL